MTTPSDDLIEQARAGAPLRPKRWSGDTHADLGGSIDEDATDELLNALADEIKRLRSALRQHETFAEIVLQYLREELERSGLNQLIDRLQNGNEQ